jgi:hypothetical protein
MRAHVIHSALSEGIIPVFPGFCASSQSSPRREVRFESCRGHCATTVMCRVDWLLTWNLFLPASAGCR